MVRQQIGFLMLIVAAAAGIVLLATISDAVRRWKTLGNEEKFEGCFLVALLLLATITTAALGILL